MDLDALRAARARSASAAPDIRALERVKGKQVRHIEGGAGKRSELESFFTQRLWREAVDERTGKVYYFNVKTKETTWRKPALLHQA